MAPSHYFKGSKKGESLNIKRLLPQDMFSTKRHQTSKIPKKSFVDETQAIEKKKQIGPGTYEKQKIRKGQAYTQDDLNGCY